jgi:anti-anti-sigma factor
MNSTVRVVELSGSLDAIVGNELRGKIKDILTSGVDIVLIDLKDITFIDSSGLGALVSAMQTVKQANSQLFICSINEQVRIVFELTKMDRILRIFADREEFNRLVLTT